MLSIAALIQPMHVAAFPLSGCQLTLTSYDAAGVEIDEAVGGSADAAREDPLRVPWDGSVRWTRGDADGPPATGDWHVEVFGVPTMLRGSDVSATTGSIQISESMPFRFGGLFFVSGQLAAADGGCQGSGWVRIVGDPLSTVPFSVGLALVLVGLVLLAVGARGGWLPGIGGGVLLGVGSAILLVLYATLPLGELTPWGLVAAGIVVGIGAGWYGNVQSRRPSG